MSHDRGLPDVLSFKVITRPEEDSEEPVRHSRAGPRVRVHGCCAETSLSMAAEEQMLSDVNFTIDHLRRLERDHVLHGAGHDEVQFCVLLQDNCRFRMANAILPALSTKRFHRCTDFTRWHGCRPPDT